MVVAQTWNEVDAVNAAVRTALRDRDLLGPGRELTAYHAVDLTLAQKQDPGTYRDGGKILFLRRYNRFLRGEVWPIARVEEDGLVLVKDGRRSTMSLDYADRLSVLEEKVLEIAPGDRLQLKWNGRSLDGEPIVNGELVTVRHIHRNGRITVDSDRGQRKFLGPDQRMFHHGYAVTSYSSQGKTVDTVLFADAVSRLATNQKQWFVTISRARRRALVFTPDKAALRRAIEAEGHRTLAVEGKRNGQAIAAIGQAHLQQDPPILSPSVALGPNLRL